MSVAKGTQTQLIVLEEQAYGIPQGTPKGTTLSVVSFESQKTQALIQPATLVATRERARPEPDIIDVAGPINYELAAEDIGVLLKHLIGSVVTTGSGPYTHTFSPADLPVGLAFELDNGALLAGASRYQSAIGCKINDASFSFPSSGYATATFGLLGQDVNYTSAPADASPLVTGHRSMALSRASLEEDGAPLAVGSDVTINVSNNVETDVRTIGAGGKRYDAPESFFDVSGTLTALFTDTVLLDKALSGLPSDLKIILQRGSGDGSADNEYIELFVEKLIYEPTSAIVSGPGTRRVNLNFTGYLDGVANSLTAIVRNQLDGVVKP